MLVRLALAAVLIASMSGCASEAIHRQSELSGWMAQAESGALADNDQRKYQTYVSATQELAEVCDCLQRTLKREVEERETGTKKSPSYYDRIMGELTSPFCLLKSYELWDRLYPFD